MAHPGRGWERQGSRHGVRVGRGRGRGLGGAVSVAVSPLGFCVQTQAVLLVTALQPAQPLPAPLCSVRKGQAQPRWHSRAPAGRGPALWHELGAGLGASPAAPCLYGRENCTPNCCSPFGPLTGTEPRGWEERPGFGSSLWREPQGYCFAVNCTLWRPSSRRPARPPARE